ncbi:DNA topoisomerase IB [soil metagenome]
MPDATLPAVAREAGLRYATDARPGFTRRRRGKGFSYHDRDGAVIRDPDTLVRIKVLAIPPAWTDVWICPWPTGHIQATGRDARGRKQYRYHAGWQVRRGTDKFERMLAFAAALPRIRRRCDRDLSRPGVPREKVLATVVRLLELTLIRVGNDEYARQNRSFGLTTLRDRHARIDGATIRFRFRGKSGRVHEVGLRDRRLATVVRRCQELPGQELFQYLDDTGTAQDVTSDDVNAYLGDAAGERFMAKDFRTWAGTVLAYRALRALGPAADDASSGGRGAVVEAMRQTADRLGNTPAVTRGSYVHPAILDAYLDGSLRAALVEAAGDQVQPPPGADPVEERAVIALLRQRQRQAQRQAGKGRTRRQARPGTASAPTRDGVGPGQGRRRAGPSG